MVVQGDALFDRASGRFNIGSVGVGSGVTPEAESVMLAVGGNLTVGEGVTALDVAFPVPGFTGGGDVNVGGTATPDASSSKYVLNGGALTTGLGADATAEYGDFGGLITQTSNDYSDLDATGTVTAAGARVDFAGSGAAREVFEIDADALSASTELYFTDIADGATVIVNVTGASVDWSPNYFADDGSRVDLADGTINGFGKVAARTMWNFADAKDVTIGGGSQMLGSVMIPASDSQLTFSASLNGRVYVNGSVTMNGSGNEIHNYPFLDQPFGCTPPDVDPGGTTDSTAPTGTADTTGTTDTSAPTDTTDTSAPTGTTDPGATTGTTATTDAPTATTAPSTTDATGTTASGLATTGGVISPWALAGGVLMLLGGSTLAILGARRRRTVQM